MSTVLPDLREQDARAVRASTAVVAQVSTTDLDRPTPCAGWDLGTLLTHMIAQHRGFAAAAAGRGNDPLAWRSEPPGTDPAGSYARAAEEVVAAVAAPGVLDRAFLLPDILPDHPFPARQAVSFHFIDYVVHGWDVARTLDIPFTLPDEVVRAALPVAEAVPDGQSRLMAGAAFAPRLAMPAGGDPMDRILALLGRSPGWSASTVVHPPAPTST